MRLYEEFRVNEPVSTVWEFFEQPDLVAKCVPGLEEVTVVDPDVVNVRATQRIGPMTATFDAKITVVERVPGELIRFNAVGKSVRGAIGNVRTSNAVRLRADEDGTLVTVEGDVILAGALGSVGQKVVAKQAAKVTADFAANLQAALGGEVVEVVGAAGAAPGNGTPAGQAASGGAQTPTSSGIEAAAQHRDGVAGPRDPWIRIAAALSALSALLSIIVLVRDRRRSQ